ncbi:MAG: Co2+/Mg2+ efflux protein ApaG [Acidobacteria bacterium]|nr:Co2+/Mg2+ efflux protein ApaG [Acidobacteriota bacterium]
MTTLDLPSSSEATTQGIHVHVEAEYDPERSQPERSLWFFLYTVTITNTGKGAVKLLHRYWTVTAGDGSQQEVDGSGVVGEHPILEPGESFSYTSGCPLATPFGAMHGSYEMLRLSGGSFRAEIAPFGLSGPYTVH